MSATTYPLLASLLRIAPSVSFTDAVIGNDNLFRAGKANEILYRNSSGNICSYNFNSKQTITSSVHVSKGNFAYLEKYNKYIGSNGSNYTIPTYNSSASYGDSITNMDNSFTVYYNLQCIWPIGNDVFYGAVYGTSGPDYTMTAYYSSGLSTPTSISRSVEYINNSSYYYFPEYIGYIHNLTDGKYALFTEKAMAVFDKNGQSYSAPSLPVNYSWYVSDGEVVIAQQSSDNRSILATAKITASDVTQMDNIPYHVYGTEDYGFFYSNGTKLYQSLDHGTSWNVIIKNLDVGTVNCILENPRDSNIYILGSTRTAILSYVNVDIVLPTWTPANDLYAYIKAKR